MTGKTKILFFASSPRDNPVLAIGEEIRAITAEIRAAKYRDVLDLVPSMAVRSGDLTRELMNQEPTIVHFSAHGSKEGELMLMDDQGQSTPVTPSSLRNLFKTLKDNIRLVVLNACYSKPQAEAIRKEIDCVVGMNDSLSDEAAIAFSASFYGTIGYARSVKKAFEVGRTQLMLLGIPEENTPELLVRRGVDPAQVFLLEVGQITSPIIRNNLEVAQAVYESSPSFVPARRERREAIAGYYRTIASTLEHVVTELRAGREPHGDCAKMSYYADQLPGHIADFVGAGTAQQLSQKLRDAYHVEGLRMELGSTPETDAQLIALDRAAAYFEASADGLLAAP